MNVLSHSLYADAFDMRITITGNAFTDNSFFVHPAYIARRVAKNLKMKSYILSYPEINLISLIKFFYNFDVQGAGPNARDP